MSDTNRNRPQPRQLVHKTTEGTTFTFRDEAYTVAPKCNVNTSRGRWLCVTHPQIFDNQLQKDTHIHEGEHELAWFCPVHGLYEVP